MKIIKLINNHFDVLSNKQKNIATYLLKNRNKIAFMSLKELSNELDITEVTILNFCKAIGLDSFTDLKKGFEDLIKEELKVPAKMKSSLEELESVEDAVKNTINIHKMNLSKITENNTSDNLYKASKLIQNANKVYLCGLGVSKLACDFLEPRLKKLAIDTIKLNLENLDDFSCDLAKATERDLFIMISFPIYSQKMLQLKDYLDENNFRQLAITNSIESPLAKNADALLISENNSLVFYNFMSATIMLSELLLIVLGYNTRDKIISDLEAIENIHDFFLEND